MANAHNAQDRSSGEAEAADAPFRVFNASGASPIVLVCEHASRVIPPDLNDLGIADEVRSSHVAWDIGAGDLAERLSELLDAPLVAHRISRLVLDCNRPPDVPGATPAKSEKYRIPGNEHVSAEERRRRAALYYHPFHAAVARQLQAALSVHGTAFLVTVHSFTRVFMDVPRDVEIGVLHDADARMADIILLSLAGGKHQCARNQPYGPEDGVTHTLKVHGVANGLPNVMLEVRNDLLGDAAVINDMARLLAGPIQRAVGQLGQSKSTGVAI